MTAVHMSDSGGRAVRRSDPSALVQSFDQRGMASTPARVVDLEVERQRRRPQLALDRDLDAAIARHPSSRARAAHPARSQSIRKRAVRAAAYVGLLVTVTAGGGALGLALRAPEYSGLTWEHSVSAGESLWSLAASVETDRPIEAVMEDIRQLNRLDKDALMVGQSLILPAR